MNFNPRSRMGSDPPVCVVRVVGRISIHAPAWGATAVVLKDGGDDLHISIHAPAWGATGRSPASGSDCIFQSTLPHGERQSDGTLEIRLGKFQSTLPHGERRATQGLGPDMVVISIHAPAWGATCLRSFES